MVATLGYSFKNAALLTQALTHPSRTGEAHYERLEFLGDTVVNLVVAELLYTTFPSESEGELAKRRAALIRGSTLAAIARELGLGAHLILGEGEKNSGGMETDSILENAFEAIVGAMYLDGGFDVTKHTILPLFTPRLSEMLAPPKDPKTTLQEWAQARGFAVPTYEILSQTGPDHAPHFRVQVLVGKYKPTEGEGSTKRDAERLAALAFLSIHCTKN